jgi:ribosome recycling factor
MSDLGLNPQNDGKVIRLTIPMLTEERRKELSKLVKKTGEDAKVALRNERREANDKFKKLNKSKEITDDDLKGYEDDVQKTTDKFVKIIDDLVSQKEAEVMEV